MGGLAATIALSTHGFHVTTLDAADGPGGKMREVEAGGRLIDAGPTVLTMRWVFEQIFEDAGAVPVSGTVALSRTPATGALPWRHPEEMALASTSIPTSIKPLRRSPISLGRARRTVIAVFANARRRSIARYATPSFADPGQAPSNWRRESDSPRLPDLLGISPFTTLSRALEDHFADPRPSPAFPGDTPPIADRRRS